MANKNLLSGLIGVCLAGAGTANAALNYVFDTTAPPSPVPCTISGSTFGNSMSCASSTSPTPALTQVMGWANTGSYSSSTAPYGTLESAYIVNYGGGVGVTNRDGTAVGGVTPDPNEGTPGATNPPEHAIDNNRLGVPGTANGGNGDIVTNAAAGSYIYDSVMLTFAGAVALTGVTIGWSQVDSDITVLAYTGAGGGSPALSGRDYAALTTSGDWKLVGHYDNLVANSTKVINGATNVDTTTGSSIASRYWLIGAYNPLVGLGGSGATQWTTGNDFVKLYSVAGVTPGGKIPEPSSAWLLFAVFGAGGWVARRRLAPALPI